uniref:Uncharacterized protein n=1 Tax=Ciona intestinalis TaxID=7719 RepID=H2Y1V0_CIOIN
FLVDFPRPIRFQKVTTILIDDVRIQKSGLVVCESPSEKRLQITLTRV